MARIITVKDPKTGEEETVEHPDGFGVVVICVTRVSSIAPVKDADMTNTIEYQLREIREGAVFLHGERTLTVKHVYFRRGRGLELHTRDADGYSGPVIWPDESLAVVYMPPLSDDDLWGLEHTTSDYPWATVR